MDLGGPRWELYRLLGEPIRLRLLALAAEEELAIGELAELLDEAQPNVSRHLKPLRTAQLLSVRKQGTRVFVRLADDVLSDAVVADALDAGRRLCREDGVFDRIAAVVRAREAQARAFFATPRKDAAPWPSEMGAYLAALAPLIPKRRLAVDVGTGHGGLLEVVAPIFERVIGVDREKVQLDHAEARLRRRGYHHVELLQAELGDESLRTRAAAHGGADAVFAARVLHHAARPRRALTQLAELVAEGGLLLVIDYAPHQDESMRNEADTWLGFEPKELSRLATAAGLCDPVVTPIPAARCGDGPDGHLDWQVLAARRP
ncbi:MAG: metalloregulator ArsR/SmtB family transcription factor [Myxococcota bacterium]